MKNKVMIVLSTINALALTYVIAFYMDARVPTHFGISGRADDWGSRWNYLLFAFLPIVLSIVFEIYKHYTKNNENIQSNAKYEEKTIPFIMLLFMALGWIFAIIAIKQIDDVGQSLFCYVMIPLGALLIYIANIMPKLSQNHTFGIRVTPTLTDEKVWTKTHRLGGYTGFIGGICIILSSIIAVLSDSYTIGFIGFGIGIFLIAVVPIVYAYSIWKK